MKGQLHMDEQRATRLLGSPERRIAVREIEIRAGAGNTYKVRGYASVAETPYDVYGGPDRGGWIETVKRGAFDVTLASKPDVSFLINHDGTPLARTKSGTLMLRSDSTGLESEAEVDRRDPEAAGLEVKMERGDLDQMSFGFRVTRQEWNEDYTERDITEVNLAGGDVSIVNWPANPATSMSIVSARSAVAVLREMEMAELRGELGGVTPAELREAQERLGSLIDSLDARACIDVHVETDDDYAEDQADGGADESTEPQLSDLVALAVSLLTQAASGLSQLSASDGGREKADAVVRRFAQLLTATEARTEPVVLDPQVIGTPVEEGTIVVSEDGSTIKSILEGTITGTFERSDETEVETPEVEAVPSRSVRSLSRYRELYNI